MGSLKNIDNNMSHITNNNITQHHPDYDDQDEYWCCSCGIDEYRAFLRRQFSYDAWEERVQPAMKQIVLSSLSCIQGGLVESKAAHCCFELVGFDFIVDDELGVWLLEINSSPSMKYATPIHRRLVPLVLKDCVRVLLGGAPPSAFTPHFEQLHTSEVAFSCSTTSDAMTGLVVEGKEVERPMPPSLPPLQMADRRELEQRLLQRRSQELQDLVENMRQCHKKEQRNLARQERFQKMVKDAGVKQRRQMRKSCTQTQG